MHFPIPSLSETFITKWATIIGWNVIATQDMNLQIIFLSECTVALPASELWLHSALVFQMAG